MAKVIFMDDINVLILCGGYSTRMKQDKCLIVYHQQPQWKYLLNLFTPIFKNCFISCRKDQIDIFQLFTRIVTDDVAFDFQGPAVGILSANKQFPNKTWLVVACDLPLITLKSINLLIEQRDVTKGATAFNSPTQNLPDPLLTLWEPLGIEELRLNVSLGITCPRKALLKMETKILDNPSSQELLNANTPKEYEQIMTILSND